MIKNRTSISVVIVFVISIYHAWFINAEIIGGDWPYFHQDYLNGLSLYPYIWSPFLGNGVGGINPLLGLYMFSASLIVPFVNWLGLSWIMVYKVGWFGLFLFLCVFSVWRLLTVLSFHKNEWALLLGSVVYTTNTYVLMIASGGQMGIALSYSLAPLVLATFISFIQKLQQEKPKQIIFSIVSSSFIFSIQLMIDARIAYVTAIGLGLCYLVFLLLKKIRFVYSISYLAIFVIIASGLNSYWLLPLYFVGSNGLDQFSSVFSSAEGVRFFSFATFENTISLLHPNWPENIFGMTQIMTFEYLVIPLIAFSCLLFPNGIRVKKYLSFFCILALGGAFLAKGANDPFGGIYIWMTDHIPGFIMFRDPTKFYVLIALSYTLLIPYSFEKISQRVNKRRLSNRYLVIILLFIWIILIRQSVMGELRGTFVSREVPSEYTELNTLITRSPEFSRVLWVPRQQRFSYYSLDHIAVEAEPLFQATNSAELKQALEKTDTIDRLSNLSIEYVVVPYDSLGELFLTDRTYDPTKRAEWENTLDKFPWLAKIQEGPLTIYKTSSYKDKIWLESNEHLTYKRLAPDKYAVEFTTENPTELNFSENFHDGWIFSTNKGIINAQKTAYGLNKFEITKPGYYSGTVYFLPQRFVTYGMMVSIITGLGILIVLTSFNNRK